MTNEEIVEKINKLFALSASSNIHEAENALKLAQKLMEKHKISEEMLNVARSQTEEPIRSWEDPLHEGKKSRSQWRIFLAQVLSGMNNCTIWIDGPQIRIVGRGSDVQTVRYMFKYCESYIEQYSKQYAGNGKGWINQYKLGCVKGIQQKLIEARSEARNELIHLHGENATNAIVKIDEKGLETNRWFAQFSKENKFTKGKTFGQQRLREGAQSLGIQDGKKINVSNGSGLKAGHKELE